MGLQFIDLFRMLRPLSAEEHIHLKAISTYTSVDSLSWIRNLVKQKRVGISFARLGVSKNLMDDDTYPEIFLAREDKVLEKKVTKLNEDILDNVRIQAYRRIAPQAKILKEFMAPNIIGLDSEKEAVLLQLFSKERIHVLLLGDPGTGKTDILRAAQAMHPISQFGLGSGTSGVGLGVAMKGNEKVPGLLPRADLGLCCIDELNLMKSVDRAALYNAMEKGFVTYDKGSKHFQMDARVRVLASANPKGDKFAGKFIDTLKKQLPFDAALLSRFHLVFLIRKPDLRGFVEITKKIVRNDNRRLKKEDADFISGYVQYAESMEINFPKKFEDQLIEFVKVIKSDEKRFLIEVSPRLVIGFIRMAQASARMHLRKEVNQSDVNHVKEIVESSLVVR